MPMISVETIVLFVMGIGVGAFGTMIGAGGGFLVAPLLIILYSFEPRIAAGTSLAFVFFNAFSGTIAYLRQRRVDVRVGLMFTALTIPGSILGAYVTSYLRSNLFKIALSLVLLVASVFLVAKPFKDRSHEGSGTYHRRIVDFRGTAYDYTVNLNRGFLISLGVGFASSIFGIGGGVIHVPAMILMLGFPVHISTATSQFILTFSSLIGSATHASLGNVRLDFAIPIGAGALIGAQAGALISRATRGTMIERLLGLSVILVAIRLLLEAL